MIFKNNAIYRFICRADTERALNVYGSTGSSGFTKKKTAINILCAK